MDTALLVCSNCSAKVYGTMDVSDESLGVPDDWSLIQPGSTGKYKGNKFEVTGRIRMQMKDDFRTLWCASYGNTDLWICQSLESMSFATTSFHEFPPKSDVDVRAGGKVSFGDKVTLKVGFAAQCMSVHFEGELNSFPYPDGNFKFVHAVNERGNTAIVVIVNNSIQTTRLLWGETMQVGAIQFENTRKFDGWQ